mmetsp:Transcript_8568/g.25946  ORF Transcript_8568/g.25946 Transcript_8568/m.25946 type:complete len:94 (+) Transcript_8568:135-416(+)
MIGLVTVLIGDMASLLGCVMCLPDDITAFTLVALGTSLPARQPMRRPFGWACFDVVQVWSVRRISVLLAFPELSFTRGLRLAGTSLIVARVGR